MHSSIKRNVLQHKILVISVVSNKHKKLSRLLRHLAWKR